jgi:hypothetical protein
MLLLPLRIQEPIALVTGREVGGCRMDGGNGPLQPTRKTSLRAWLLTVSEACFQLPNVWQGRPLAAPSDSGGIPNHELGDLLARSTSRPHPNISARRIFQAVANVDIIPSTEQ